MRQWTLGSWAYEWNANGSLKSVKKPSGQTISFEYDALGRRTKKFVKDKTIHYIWSGNVLLHEIFDNGNEQKTATYVYEQGSFVPTAKLIDNKSFSIVSDYIGRPIQVYDQDGNSVWSTEYDIYGKLINLQGDKSFIPFRQLGQYEDVETGLYYNRFRYYDCNTGAYISQDPISILGGLNVYAYVHDSNTWVDPSGLYIVYALFEMQGQIFEGINPTHRVPRVKGDIKELQHLGMTNSNTFDMHAEIDAMKKAKDAGLEGGKGVLMVEGLDICPSCRPAIMEYAKSMNITELEIYELDSNKKYLFKDKEINLVKNGGKSWKKAEIHH